MNSENLKTIISLRHQLHQHPELSKNESWTKAHLISFFQKNTKFKIIDRGAWFYAFYFAGADKQNLAFRAEMDAVRVSETNPLPYASQFPGLAHKCGHDGHCAALVGLALEIEQNGADKNIFFLFQHAEETGEGALECVDFINENNIEEIYAFHNKNEMKKGVVNIIDGTSFCASRGMIIYFTGIPSHASEPEKGINPAFAMAKIIDAIPELVSPHNKKGMVLCTIIQVAIGEETFGISASEGRLLLTIRAAFEEELDELQNNLEKLARVQASTEKLQVHFSYQDIFPETSNHKECSDKIRKVCELKGIPLEEMKAPFRASEDFGHYLKRAQGAICFIGNGEDYPPLHSQTYDFPDEILETAVELFKGLVELSSTSCELDR